MTENSLAEDESGADAFTVWADYEQISKDELTKRLDDCFDEAYEVFMPQDGARYFECFLEHTNISSQEIESESLYTLQKENPFRLVALMRTLTLKKTFLGTCDICKDW